MPVFTIHDVTIDLPDSLATAAVSARLTDGSYEATEIAAALCRVGPGMRVLDLGAGLGLVSVLTARIAGAENVTSVEANPALLPVLRDTFKRIVDCMSDSGLTYDPATSCGRVLGFRRVGRNR